MYCKAVCYMIQQGMHYLCSHFADNCKNGEDTYAHMRTRTHTHIQINRCEALYLFCGFSLF